MSYKQPDFRQFLTVSIAGPYPAVTTADNIQRAWAELTTLIRETNTLVFESKYKVRYCIQSGNYMDFIEKFAAKLENWKERFDQTKDRSS